MALKLGLDFGTTTSILSYVKNGELNTFRYGGESNNAPSFTPTAVLYEEDDLLIGRFALKAESENLRPELYFKLRLALEEEDGVGELRPAEKITADFIGEFIKGSCPYREKNAAVKINTESFINSQHAEIESIVMAIPHSWDDEASVARRRLRRAVSETLGLPLAQFVSEPLAAAAFFSYRYKQSNPESFKGNLLVCDMGGGTFNAALCGLGIDSSRPIAQADSDQGDGFGIAGNYFDRTLIETCIEEFDPVTLPALMQKLDEEKKSQAEVLQQALRGEKSQAYPIYMLRHDSEALPIRLSDLTETFSDVEKSMRDVLRKIITAAGHKKESIDRVVLVGGFSKFPLVQDAVRKFLGEEGFDADTILDLTTFTIDDRAYAISYGACLIANDLVEITGKYQNSIGVKITDANGEDLVIDLIKEGTSLGELADCKLVADEKGSQILFRLEQGEFQIDFVGKKNDEVFATTGNFKMPDGFGSESGRFFIGSRVDKRSIPYLIVQDEKSGDSFERSLGQIIEYEKKNTE